MNLVFSETRTRPSAAARTGDYLVNPALTRILYSKNLEYRILSILRIKQLCWYRCSAAHQGLVIIQATYRSSAPSPRHQGAKTSIAASHCHTHCLQWPAAAPPPSLGRPSCRPTRSHNRIAAVRRDPTTAFLQNAAKRGGAEAVTTRPFPPPRSPLSRRAPRPPEGQTVGKKKPVVKPPSL